jgi:hypothetical protein
LTLPAFRYGAWLLLTLACVHGNGAPAAAPAALTDRDDASAVFVYTTQAGDTLIGVSARLLADPWRWREVASGNGLRHPDRIGIGQSLRIPMSLLRSEVEPARVLAVNGNARSASSEPLGVGQALEEGKLITTGADGNVTVQLVDGTLLRLRANSRLEVTASRRVPGAGATRSATRLDTGRVEIKAGHSGAGQPGFRVQTPHGVLAVRGTEYRVEVAADRSLTRGEVLQGTVAFSGQAVGAGLGSSIDSTGQVAPPSPLPAAPDLRELPALQERVLVRFRLPQTDRVTAWRAQVAHDASFDGLVADLTTTGPELRFADLPDGDFVLRVRAIDDRGLEGYDAEHRFRLKARPEAPLPSAPASAAVLFGERVEFAWASNAEAAHYRLQLAGDAGFGAALRDLADLRGPSVTVDKLTPGRYQWRVRSIRRDADAGPWGDARTFEIRPQPPTPPPPRVGNSSLQFSWDGTPGQRFDFQLARDAAFTTGMVALHLERPVADLPLPGTGRFWIRLRVQDADGFVGPWTAPQSLDLPNCLRDSSGACVKSGDGTIDLSP